MNINKELLEKISKNARLSLTEQEKKDFEKQLNDVLTSFSELDQVNTEKIEPSFHPINIEQSFREDKTRDCLTQEEALSNTKNKKDGFFKGPKV